MPPPDFWLRMYLPHSHTAVLLFALPDSAEADRKRVSRQSAAVWRAMRALTRTKVRLAGLPLLESDRLIDHRGTFGEQFSAAVSAVLARGYERVICLGNDCPDLSVSDLKQAAGTLTNGRVPIGADCRGGVYLVGIDRVNFDPDTLARLPWQTNRLADALRSYLGTYGTLLTELATRTDVNQRADAQQVRWSGQVAGRLLSVVRQALLPVRVPRSFFVPATALPLIADRQSGRAPPRCG